MREGLVRSYLVSFDSLGLAPDLLRAVAAEGYTTPTPVQQEAIPLVLAGRDVLAAAQTGTGKTAAFVLPILQMLAASRPAAPQHGQRPGRGARPAVRALVLTPTRELALQVEESVRTYGAQRPIRSTTIYGGVGFDNQVRALRAGAEIVVATPGRLLDHVGQGTIDLSRVEILVLDEADRMLDMGFIRDIRKILALLPARRQNLLFSATFSDEIRRLADGLLDQPASVQVAPRNTAAELVRQVVHPVDRERKRELLSQLVRSGQISQALVFTRTKHGANRLAEQLGRDGIAAAAIHGNKSQAQRVRALADFKQGRVAILVATDIAARGLDIDALPHVVNYELPMVPEDYVHRIGRTGRAGMEGHAVSLVCVDEQKLLRDVEMVLRRPIPTEVVPGFEPNMNVRPEPIRLRSAGGVQQQQGRRPVAPRPPASGGRPAQLGGRPSAEMSRYTATSGVSASQRPRSDRPQRASGAPNGARRAAGSGLGNGAQPGTGSRSSGSGRPAGNGSGRDQRTDTGRGPSGGDFRSLPGERLARSGGPRS
jgi:ATP-dependent RNA helicase RhlE